MDIIAKSPDTVGDDEDLARFLTQSGHFNTTAVKPSAFLPSPSAMETSVFRCHALPADRLWSMGLAAAGERKLYGAAIIKARHAREIRLGVYPDEPPPRHAAIRDWPIEGDPDIQKARHKELALHLASKAGSPVMRPQSGMTT